MKVSIITATLNSENNILNNLNSVHSQKYRDLEHLIQDCCSSDQTIKLINQFSLKKNKLIKIESIKDNGIFDALNKAIKRSTGDIIGILHSDDIFSSPDIINKIVNEFKKRPDISGVYGNLVYTNQNRKIIRKWISKKYNENLLKFGWMPPHPTLFLRKEIFQEFGYYDYNYRVSGDYDFIVRIFKNEKIKFTYIPINITDMKIGGNSNKFKNLFQKSYEDFKIIKKYRIGGLLTLFLKNISKIKQFF